MGPGLGLLAALRPSAATLWPVEKGAWALVEGTQDALLAPRFPGASQLASAADVTRSIEAWRGS